MRPISLTPMPVLLLVGGVWGCDPPAPEPVARSAVAVAPARGDTLSGSELAASFGCGACHPGAPAPTSPRERAPDLTGLAARWPVGELVAYLVDPRPLREGVLPRMPDYHLDRAEGAAVAMHLLRDQDSRSVRSALGDLRREHPGATAERGAAIVDALNCAGCHRGTGTDAWLPGPALRSVRERLRPEWLRRYLAAPTAIRPFGYHPGSGSRMPDFDLSPAEADSLAGWLAGGVGEPAAGEEGGLEPEPAGVAGSVGRHAKRLLQDHLACLGCHSLGGEGGRIAPALDGAGARLRPEYLRRIVHAPTRTVPGTIMPNPVEDSATLERVVAYLALEAPAGSGSGSAYLSLVDHRPARPQRTGARTPAALYGAYCAACHGATGQGDGFNAAYLPRPPTPHADSAHMSARPDDTLFDGIHGGGHILGRSHRMPAFGETLTRSEIGALVAHLRELCRCAQPGWAEAP